MKIILRNLSLLAMALATFSCNEKISPQLQNGSSTTLGGGSGQQPNEYYIKITNQSPVVLNYVLHRTGEGKKVAPCQVNSSGTAFSSDLFLAESATPYDDKIFDISCFFEAEELSLHFNGLSFQIEASKNTCDYISYMPYSYYNGIPGKTTANWLGINCDGAAPTPLQVSNLGATYSGAATPIGCGQMVDTNLPVASRKPVDIVDEYKTFCAFDYSENTEGFKQNCDVGKMSFKIWNFVKDVDAVTVGDQSGFLDFKIDSYKCGGKVEACIEGAIKNVSKIADKGFAEEITEAVLNQEFKIPYKLAPLEGTRFGNVDIVNFRRGLASLDLNYGDYTPASESSLASGVPSWQNTNDLKSFDPNLMEAYALNKYPEISTRKVISQTQLDAQASRDGWKKTPYAADPFLSTDPSASRISPFYTVLCLDKDKDIKARIRMVVRDWDRTFATNSEDLEYISDVNKAEVDRRQDKPTFSLELPGDPNASNLWNDYSDWDNLVWLKRNSPSVDGTYSAGFTTWEPMTPEFENSAGALVPSTQAWDPVFGWDPSVFPWVDRTAN